MVKKETLEKGQFFWDKLKKKIQFVTAKIIYGLVQT